MARALLHQRFIGHLRNRAYPSLCTIQYNTPVRDGYGQPIGAWTNLLNHENLACALVPVSAPGMGGETKTPSSILEIATHTLYLNGHYPSLTPAMRVIMPDEPYDILLVQIDSRKRTTKLTVRMVI